MSIVERALVALVVLALFTAALTPPYHDVDESGVLAIGNRVAMAALAVTIGWWFL
jgi:hypothetical protein